MRYTVLIYSNPDVVALFADMTDEQKNAAYQIYWDVQNDLEASGELVDSKAIDEAGQRYVSVDVEVADEARAIAIAARFPEARVPHGIRVARNFTQADFDAVGM